MVAYFWYIFATKNSPSGELLVLAEVSVYLNDAGGSEGFERTLFVDGADAPSRKGNANVLFELRNVDAALLEVWVSANFSGRVKLRCAGSVAETAAYHRTFFCNWANFRHMCCEKHAIIHNELIKRHALPHVCITILFSKFSFFCSP